MKLSILLATLAMMPATFCFSNEIITVRGSLSTGENDWGAVSSIETFGGTIYILDHPYMGDGSGAHGAIDYHCANGSYVVQTTEVSEPTADGKVIESCTYSLVSLECRD
jgi:hypothetical protein